MKNLVTNKVIDNQGSNPLFEMDCSKNREISISYQGILGNIKSNLNKNKDLKDIYNTESSSKEEKVNKNKVNLI